MDILDQLSPDGPRIVDRGRGPEIEGSRVTVWDVRSLQSEGFTPGEAAKHLRVTSAAVETMIAYIVGLSPDEWEHICRRGKSVSSPAEPFEAIRRRLLAQAELPTVG